MTSFCDSFFALFVSPNGKSTLFPLWGVPAYPRNRNVKTCKIEPPDLLFLVALISFYISKYHFSQIFRSSFNIICIKDFRHKFFFYRIHSPPLLWHKTVGQYPNLQEKDIPYVCPRVKDTHLIISFFRGVTVFWFTG